MNLSSTLWITIQIFFFILIVSVLVSSGLVLHSIFIAEVPFYVLNGEGSNTDFIDKTIIVIAVVLELVYVAMVFYLRRGIIELVSGNLFHETVAKNLNIAGMILIFVSIGRILLKFTKELSDGVFNIGFETPLFNSKIFMVIMGLFLMLMARVIKEGLALKSENDLTI